MPDRSLHRPSNHISEGLDAATAKASPKTRQEVAKPFRHVIASEHQATDQQ